MGFRVWSAAVSAQGTVKETAGSVNVPVSVGGQIVRPGDAIVADDDGVVCVPRGDVARRWRPRRARVAKEERAARPWPTASSAWTSTTCAPCSPSSASSTSRPGTRKADGAERDGIRCMLMRGGTSKGAYFLAEDLPADPAARDDLLLRIMGSPDPRQIDGIGGAHPLTSKVAVVSRVRRPDADVDYLFLQVGVDQAIVTDRQNCGNLLAGVGPFAVERGLAAGDGHAGADPHGQHRGASPTATLPTPGGVVDYDGDTAIDGVPGTAAPIVLDFAETEGRSPARCCRPGTSPTRSRASTSPASTTGCRSWWCAAAEFGRTGYETVAELEADAALRRADRRRSGSRPAS